MIVYNLRNMVTMAKIVILAWQFLITDSKTTNALKRFNFSIYVCVSNPNMSTTLSFPMRKIPTLLPTRQYSATECSLETNNE